MQALSQLYIIVFLLPKNDPTSLFIYCWSWKCSMTMSDTHVHLVATYLSNRVTTGSDWKNNRNNRRKGRTKRNLIVWLPLITDTNPLQLADKQDTSEF